MKANVLFLQQRNEFWAYVRTISQSVGYTNRITRGIHIPTIHQIHAEFMRLGLSTAEITDKFGNLTSFGRCLLDYFQFRADILNNTVRLQLMDRESAEANFHSLKSALNPTCPLPLNKQTGEKKNFAFLTGIVNMLVQANIGNNPCDYDPRSLTTLTHNSMPFRTLARRVDGAFPSAVNPVAIWEIKEYYYTKTFGSRVADGVYETLLDGMELKEYSAATQRKVEHILIIDDRYTWWECGRSYLCRIIDMLHMGLVDEVIFGSEVFDRVPQLAREWTNKFTHQLNQNI